MPAGSGVSSCTCALFAAAGVPQMPFHSYLDLSCPSAAVLQLRESLVSRSKSKPGAGTASEALACVGVLAGALHLSWQPYAQQLLDCMMLTGPTQVRGVVFGGVGGGLV